MVLDLTHKHYTQLERPPRAKHSSLLWIIVTYSCEMFYDIGPWLKMLLSDKHSSLLHQIYI